MSVSEPSKILTPWATSGLKNAIPSAADPVTGKAGYDQGFPAINMTAKEAGGIPPFGQDFNGIFFDITKILQYMQSGGHPTYSPELSTAIGGYRLGAMLAKASGLGFWRNITANNTSNPDSGGAGWVSDAPGSYANASIVTAPSTTLAVAQAGQAFLFTTAASAVALPAASSVAAGGTYKLHTSVGFTLSVTGGGEMQVGSAPVTSFYVPAGTEVLAVSAGAGWWVFGTAINANIMIGVPIPWPTATPPNGYIALTGQSINQTTDPLLYARYGATAPDMRAEIVRGWDNGRGVDAGRVLLSAQGDAIRNITGSFGNFAGQSANSFGGGDGAFYKPASTPWGECVYPSTTGSTSSFVDGLAFDASRQVPTAAENRMRNVAWNYITLRG